MDPMTGLLLWSTEACTLAFLLIAAWMHDRDSKVTGLWGLGFACHGIGVCLVAMRGSVPTLYPLSSLTNLCCVASPCGASACALTMA